MSESVIGYSLMLESVTILVNSFFVFLFIVPSHLIFRILFQRTLEKMLHDFQHSVMELNIAKGASGDLRDICGDTMRRQIS